MHTTSILVADDDPTISTLLNICLKTPDYKIHQAKNGREVVQFLNHETPDLIILDLAMPMMNGFEVCTWIRNHDHHVPIMILSALPGTEHVVRALDAGADDYLVKPFKPEEFKARLRALLRRSERNEWIPAANKIVFEGVTIDLRGQQVYVDGVRIHLTRTEIAILLALAEQPDNILTTNQLLAKVWGAEFRGSNHYLYVYLSRIRQKMGDKYGKLLETCSKSGYMLHSSFQTLRSASPQNPLG